MSWQKTTLIGTLFAVIIIVVLEIAGLLFLYFSVGNFKKHWEKRATKPGELVYVALGDSAAQGVGATSAERSYVGLITKRIEKKTGKKVKVVNLSQSGAKVQDALQNQIPMLRKYTPDIVTVEIGANDIASFNETKFRQDFERLLRLLPQNTYVSNMPYFGSRPHQRPSAFEASAIIENLVESQGKHTFVDLQTITQNRDSLFNYAPDYFHPNNRAYHNWADAFWKEIEKEL